MTDRAARDVVVVGAGITGLALATHLVARHVDVLVLEARDRVGGRLLSIPTGTGAIDLGASWYWADETRVHTLVRDLDIPVHAQAIAGDALLQVPGGVQRVKGNPIDAPAQRFSAGAQSLALALAAPLADRIRMATPVLAVRVDGSGVEVRHDGGTVLADQVVLAVPPALAIATIAVDPPLPDDVHRLAARTPVWMGQMTKAVAVYGEPFWRREGLAGAAISYTGPLREIHDLSGPGDAPAALFGFASPEPEPLTEAAVRTQLATLFGPAAGAPRELHLLDWRAEAWTSPPNVEALGAYETFGARRYREAARPAVWLASTETAPDHAGHIEGALAAAELVAEQVLAARAARASGPTTPS